MATQHKNIMFLALTNNYIGTTIYLDDGAKVIKDILDYDSITHVFNVEFENGDIQQLSDKTRYKVEFPTSTLDTKVRRRPNKRRGRKVN